MTGHTGHFCYYPVFFILSTLHGSIPPGIINPNSRLPGLQFDLKFKSAGFLLKIFNFTCQGNVFYLVDQGRFLFFC